MWMQETKWLWREFKTWVLDSTQLTPEIMPQTTTVQSKGMKEWLWIWLLIIWRGKSAPSCIWFLFIIGDLGIAASMTFLLVLCISGTQQGWNNMQVFEINMHTITFATYAVWTWTMWGPEIENSASAFLSIPSDGQAGMVVWAEDSHNEGKLECVAPLVGRSPWSAFFVCSCNTRINRYFNVSIERTNA